MLINYEELQFLYSRTALSKLSKNPKKIYKDTLVNIFLTSLRVGDYGGKKLDYFFQIHFCKDILENPKDYLDETPHKQYEAQVQDALCSFYIRNPYNEKTKNTIIELVRNVVEQHLNGERYLIKAKELDNLMDLKNFLKFIYRNANPNLSPHHWVEVDLERGIIPTFPDFLTYAHLISLWNIYVDKQIAYKEEQHRLKERTLDSELHALHTVLWTQAVTFTESYLYYIFYNINKGDYSLKSEKAKGYIKANKPDDNQIIVSLIIPEFKSKGNEELVSNIKKLHKEYEAINNIRNRYIHASAFDDNQRSHLLPLISNRSEQLIKALEVCTNLVKAIENLLPSELKILFWWDAMDHPVYKDYEKGNFIKRTDI
ncbi:hypothetical protein [Priestia aryabhattai]